MVPLKSILYSQFVTYDRLASIVSLTCANSKAEIANVYIDVTSLIKSIFRFGDNLEVGHYTNLTAILINMAAHYRSFFAKGYNVRTKIYLVHSHNLYEKNKILYPGYNKSYEQLYLHDKKIKDIVESNINLLSLLCPYLPDIFYLPTELETGVAMGIIMNNNAATATEEEMNFVISKDIYNFQLASYPNTIVIRPKKNYNLEGSSDISYPIIAENCWQAYFYGNKMVELKPSILISPALMSLVMAFAGLKQRDVPRTIGAKETLKTLENLILSNRILNGYPTDTLNIIGMISSCSKHTFDIMSVYNKFKAIDIPFQMSFLNDDPAAIRLSSYLINSYDPEAVRQINNEYFKDEPLDLNRI